MSFPKMREDVHGRTFDEDSTGRTLGVPAATIDDYLSIRVPCISGSAVLDVYYDGVLRARRLAWAVR